jgi:hypothetical protein
MENDTSDIFIFPADNNDDCITGAAGTDVITITLPEDNTYYTYGNDSTTMASNSVGLTTSLGSGTGSAVLSSTGAIGATTWTTTPNISLSGGYQNASIHISGENPKLKTDAGEIDLNELSSMVQIMKDMIDRNSIPLPDVTMLNKHEVLQQSWEDVKQAYENYRITEALLKSTPPGDDDDQ